MTDYSVDLTIETTDRITIERLEGLASVGGAAAGNVGEHRLGTTLTIEAPGPAEAISTAIDLLAIPGEIVAAEAVTVAEADARLMQPAFPVLAGVTEVADMLGISRQRLHALRARDDFPSPVAMLAAGPVWRKGDLTTFAEGWQRKPGRPRLTA
jgi:hypothetical protein